MSEQSQPIAKLPPVAQIGIVVSDMDTAVDYYAATFGWGPFKITEFDMKGFTYKGHQGDCRMKLARTHQGQLEIELIQILEGETPHTEFLQEKGEGLHHLGILVDDLESVLSEMARANIQPIFHKSYPEIGLAFAYLDTDKVGGVMLELIQMRKPGEGKDK